MVNHMMSASSSSPMKDWIVDSGATCHMWNDDKLFVKLRSLNQPLEVTLEMDAQWKRQGKEMLCWR